MSNATQNEEAFFAPPASEKLDNGNLFPYWYVSNLHRSDLTTDVDSSGATIRINHGCYCEASQNYYLRVYLGTTREDGSNPTSYGGNLEISAGDSAARRVDGKALAMISSLPALMATGVMPT